MGAIVVSILFGFTLGSLFSLLMVAFALGLAAPTIQLIADRQLHRFIATRREGEIIQHGLWAWSRHPNYFGDFLVWWGIYLVAAEAGSWWWTIVGPLLMSVLLIRVSGVQLLENSLRNRIAGYEEYVAATSAFFPLPPKQVASLDDT